MRQHVHAAETAMSCAWTTDGSLKTSSPENLCRENVPQADHSCDSKVCKRDLKVKTIDQNNWEATVLEWSAWRQHEDKRMRGEAAASAHIPVVTNDISFHARVRRFSPFLYLRSVAIAVILF